MRRFFGSRTFKFSIALLLTLMLGSTAAAVTDGGTSPVTDIAAYLFSPLQKISAFIGEKLSGVSARFASSDEYVEKIEQQQSKIADYEKRLVDYEKTKQKLEAYEAFLEVKADNPDFEFVPSCVIARDSADVYNSFTLDKGSADGISVNMPVIYGSNLVGIVTQVRTTTCTVGTILDPKINVSAYEISSREEGYVSTDTDLSLKGLIKLSGLTRSTPVVSGGIVCTSGIGGLYPRDLIIGTVTEIFDEDTDISSYALIEPGVDFTSLEDVFIITRFEGQGEQE